MNYLMNGLAALAFIVLFSQCVGKTDNQTTSTPAQANAELSGMKIAYVEIDTLLAKYNFCIDLNEAMVKKSENVRMTLNQKATSLNKEKQDFQKKVENNAFLSQDRAQQEYNRLVKLPSFLYRSSKHDFRFRFRCHFQLIFELYRLFDLCLYIPDCVPTY